MKLTPGRRRPVISRNEWTPAGIATAIMSALLLLTLIAGAAR